MQRNWITAALQRQLKICRAIAGTRDELEQIEKIEDAILTATQTQAVSFATATTQTNTQEVEA